LLYRLLFKVLLGRVPPETAHLLAARALGLLAAVPGVRWALRRTVGRTDRSLEVRALGRTFSSPLGAAAGMDKGAGWFEALGALGFGFVEVGTVTACEQPGKPRPRVWRLPEDRALVNRMGFPNPGADAVAARLTRRRGGTVVGVSIGRSRVTPPDEAGGDYRATARRLAELADFVVLNVSSPNTPGLGAMQAVEPLRTLVLDVREELNAIGARVPLLVKIGPDLGGEAIDAIADLAVELELDGIVATNTTAVLEGLAPHADGSHLEGGLSGAPLKERSLAVLQRLHTRAGSRLVLISVGGIEDADDAWRRIRAGATLVQAYTGFVYGGPLWPRRVNQGITRRLRESGCSSLGQAVGTAARHGPGTRGPLVG
jgi:dihydroorotate dehydrogenase